MHVKFLVCILRNSFICILKNIQRIKIMNKIKHARAHVKNNYWNTEIYSNRNISAY